MSTSSMHMESALAGPVHAAKPLIHLHIGATPVGVEAFPSEHAKKCALRHFTSVMIWNIGM
jgi:hypothetical protein